MTNKRLIRILKEASKVLPLEEIFTDINHFSCLGYTIYQYNENISTKFVVGMSLYYKTLDNLGTSLQNAYKERSQNLEDIGCFALTELGHGSNVRGIQTTATYDKQTQEYIIHTPNDAAMKFWIGGASQTSNVAAIFAQLYIEGTCYGPHAFVLDIRDRKTH